ncbi:MAG: Lacal_2735 family protein [Flavobacteriaceae bacterium]|nr:Lacal_2735 family protein [Flavobacteriaceae bacterium]
MFGIFKRKTEKEKLLIRYKKIKNEAFILSKID